jgi:hypothetical protein
VHDVAARRSCTDQSMDIMVERVNEAWPWEKSVDLHASSSAGLPAEKALN